jgi:hypothetical protein
MASLTFSVLGANSAAAIEASCPTLPLRLVLHLIARTRDRQRHVFAGRAWNELPAGDRGQDRERRQRGGCE